MLYARTARLLCAPTAFGFAVLWSLTATAAAAARPSIAPLIAADIVELGSARHSLRAKPLPKLLKKPRHLPPNPCRSSIGATRPRCS